ncbi:hypothetical protein LINPERHAP1_LOCUS20673 [Linum perenne]
MLILNRLTISFSTVILPQRYGLSLVHDFPFLVSSTLRSPLSLWDGKN